MRASASTLILVLLMQLVSVQRASAQPTPKFEATEVHRSERISNPYTFMSGGVLRGTRYDLRKATLLALIQRAYDVPAEKILGGPNWLEFDRFDIAGKAPAGSSPTAIRQMLQSLLADRFNLAVHNDLRPVPAYAITVGTDKPKLTRASEEGTPDCTYIQQPNNPAGRAYHCSNIPMQDFAERLRGMAGDYLTDPVVDATGLEGTWDFDLRWNQRLQPSGNGSGNGVERITIFDAVEKQLGLKLELRSTPAPVLVIDRVADKPTDNAPNIAQALPPLKLEFEVATVRKSFPNERQRMQVTATGDLEVEATPLQILMGAAWDLDWSHTDVAMSGLPGWTNTAQFDIKGKTPVPANGPPPNDSGFVEDDVRLMLRALLIDRFHIQYHYENRPVDAYVLVNAKSKLKKADPAHRGSCKEASTVANDPRDRNPILSRLMACQSTSMAQFAAKLQGTDPDRFAFPVQDATDIQGAWDFTLSYTPDYVMRTFPGKAANGAAAEPSGAISLTDAIRQQMGLKLELRKRMLPVVVIDHMEQTPDEN